MEAEIYTKNGINFTVLTHLTTLWLISFWGFSSYQRTNLPKNVPIFYGKEAFILTLPNEEKNNIDVWYVLLSEIGRDLASFATSEEIDWFMHYVTKEWLKNGMQVSPRAVIKE